MRNYIICVYEYVTDVIKRLNIEGKGFGFSFLGLLALGRARLPRRFSLSHLYTEFLKTVLAILNAVMVNLILVIVIMRVVFIILKIVLAIMKAVILILKMPKLLRKQA